MVISFFIRTSYLLIIERHEIPDKLLKGAKRLTWVPNNWLLGWGHFLPQGCNLNKSAWYFQWRFESTGLSGQVKRFESRMTRLLSDRSAMSSLKTLSPQVHWATNAAWHWGSGLHSEGEKALLVWTCGMLQWCNQDSLWHTGWWKGWAWEAEDDMEAADREGLQRAEALGYQPS